MKSELSQQHVTGRNTNQKLPKRTETVPFRGSIKFRESHFSGNVSHLKWCHFIKCSGYDPSLRLCEVRSSPFVAIISRFNLIRLYLLGSYHWVEWISLKIVSSSSRPCTKSFGDCTKCTTCKWYHRQFHVLYFFSLVFQQDLGIYLSFHFLLVLPCSQPKQQSLLYGKFSFLLTMTWFGYCFPFIHTSCNFFIASLFRL